MVTEHVKRRVAQTGKQGEQCHGTMLRARAPELTYGTAIHCFVRAEREVGERVSERCAQTN